MQIKRPGRLPRPFCLRLAEPQAVPAVPVLPVAAVAVLAIAAVPVLPVPAVAIVSIAPGPVVRLAAEQTHFTPPAVRPATIRRWNSSTAITSGIVTTTPAAI